MTPEKHKEWEEAYHRCLDKEALKKAYKQDENEIKKLKDIKRITQKMLGAEMDRLPPYRTEGNVNRAWEILEMVDSLLEQQPRESDNATR